MDDQTRNRALKSCKNEGLPMTSLYNGRSFGWTTDKEKADRLRDTPMVTVQAGYNKPEPRGWEISVGPAEILEEEDA